MNAPVTEGTTTWHVILVPLDKRVKPLVIPVVCFRPSLRYKGLSAQDNEAVRLVRPDRINLGVISRGEERRFEVSGPSKLVNSLKVAGLDNLPEGTKVELHPINGSEKDSLDVTIRLAKSAPWGLLDGRVRLTSPDGYKYSIEVFGIVGPEDSEKKSNEAKDGPEPGKAQEKSSLPNSFAISCDETAEIIAAEW